MAKKIVDYSNLDKDKLIEVIYDLLDQNNKLKALLFAGKSEKSKKSSEKEDKYFNESEELSSQSDDQNLESEDTNQDATGSKEPKHGSHEHKKHGGGRTPLPPTLERRKFLLPLPDSENHCSQHDCRLTKIGEKFMSEQLEYIPGQLYIRENYIETCKCSKCDIENLAPNIIQSQLPEFVIPKSFASPSLLAQIIIGKYVDALPIYRQESIFQRLGVELSRATISRWIIHVGKLVQPIINLMTEDLKNCPVIHVDETTCQVLKEKDRSATTKSYMWVAATAIDAPIVIFNYHQNRSAKAGAELLEDYDGIVVADGFSAYPSLARQYHFLLAGCMAHVRRKFFEAEKFASKANIKSERNNAILIINAIKKLYAIERDLKDSHADFDRIFHVRTAESSPVFNDMFNKISELTPIVTPKSLLGKALSYALDMKNRVSVFLSNGRVPIDNNRAENYIRPFAVGRKNWTFFDTPQGAQASANLYSLTSSAKACGISEDVYLQHIFQKLPLAKTIDDFADLMPHKCKYLALQN